MIRCSAVYDLGSNGHKPDGIYMDDALSGQTIFGNLLVNVPGIGKGESLFAGFANGDYTLADAPDGFEPLPLNETGRY